MCFILRRTVAEAKEGKSQQKRRTAHHLSPARTSDGQLPTKHGHHVEGRESGHQMSRSRHVRRLFRAGPQLWEDATDNLEV